MKTAVVTGASSGIGEAIARRLLMLGYRVIGISKTITQDKFENKNFIAYQADLTQNIDELTDFLQEQEVFVLVNCAGYGVFEPHEELNTKTIQNMTTLNLITPMLITNKLLRALKKNGGYIININSIEALRPSKFAALYSATKSGLMAFGEALFEECRKSDLSITNINPDMTQSSFYKNLRFETSQSENEKLFADDIADAIEHILKMRKGAVVTNYTIRSLNFGIVKKSVSKA